MKKMRKKEKRGLKGVMPPETAQKNVFFIRNVPRKHSAIEAKNEKKKKNNKKTNQKKKRKENKKNGP